MIAADHLADVGGAGDVGRLVAEHVDNRVARDRGNVGGGRRIEARFESGYPYAQVYAPLDDDVVAFEPMTTPTNALAEGESMRPVAVPGTDYRARFSIRVIDAPAD